MIWGTMIWMMMTWMVMTRWMMVVASRVGDRAG
jgi:hypothetical protein